MASGLLPALRDAGFQDHVIAGLLANAQHESGGDPTAVGDNGNALGLWQWNGPRAYALMDFAKSRNLNPKRMETQVAFLKHELDTDYSETLQRMQSAKSPEAASSIFTREFEKPANVAEKAIERARDAADAYKYLTKNRKPDVVHPPSIVQNIEKAIAPVTETGGRMIKDFVEGAIDPTKLVTGGELSPERLAEEDEYQARGGFPYYHPLRAIPRNLGAVAPLAVIPGAGTATQAVGREVGAAAKGAGSVAAKVASGPVSGPMSGAVIDTMLGGSGVIGALGGTLARALLRSVRRSPHRVNAKLAEVLAKPAIEVAKRPWNYGAGMAKSTPMSRAILLKNMEDFMSGLPK